MGVMIAPSILSADFAKMGDEIKRMENAGADLIHCDVMDGVFVKNITFGIKMIADIRKITKLPLDVHLMIVEPEKYLERFIDAGADYLTFHYEASKTPAESLRFIKDRKVKAGIVINPDTPVSSLQPFVELADMILLMSVFPGFGGQKYIKESTQRMRELDGMRKTLKADTLLEIDGGINFENAGEIIGAGADILVAGNTVFGSPDPKEAIAVLKSAGC